MAQVALQHHSGQRAEGAPVALCQAQDAQTQFPASLHQATGEKIDPQPMATVGPAGSGGFSGFQDAVSFPTLTTVANDRTTMVTLAADFLKTGRSDLLTIDTSAQLHLLANKGEGTFAEPVTSDGTVSGSYGTSYIGAVVQDYDGDGYPDVIARDHINYRLSFFRNNRDGTFTLAKHIDLPEDYNAGAMLLGDVTGDGVADLITFADLYDYSSGNTIMEVLVYAGTGTGDFNPTAIETDYTFEGAQVVIPNGGALLGLNAGRKSLYIEALSLNGQGVNGASAFALGSKGDGTFLANPYTQQDFPTDTIYANTNNGGMTIADLNGDGIPDLTMNFADGFIYSALGQSDGSFPTVTVAGPDFAIYAESTVLTDVNGDGYPDLLVKSADTLEVLPGLGTGKFGPPTKDYTVSNSDSASSSNAPGFNMVYADFTGEGVADVMYVDNTYNGYNRAVLMTGQGSGDFQGPIALPANSQLGYDPGHLYGEAMFDTNGDGRSDVIALDTNGSGPYFLRTALSDQNGGFKLVQALPATQGKYLLGSVRSHFDFNRDGLQDLVLDAYTSPAAYTYNYTLAVALSKGDGTFGNPVVLDTGGTVLQSLLSSVAVGDISGDGIPDIVAVTAGGSSDTAAILIFLGNRDGTFQTAVTTPYGNSYTYAGIALADFNGDGKLDLFLSDDGASGSTLPASSIIFGDNSGTFHTAKAVTLTSGVSVRKALIGDLNGDGKADIVLLSAGTVSGYEVTTTDRAAIVYLNDGQGGFTRGSSFEAGSIAGTGLLADFNGDGKLDLVFAVDYPWDRDSADNAGVHLLLGKGDGTFGDAANLTLPPSVSFLASGDLDGDGTQDLMSFSFYVGSIAVLRNISGTSLGLTADQSSIDATQGVNFTATVAATVSHRASPQGDATFQLGSTTLGTATLAGGTATFHAANLPVGTDKITAVYSGDSNFSVSPSAATVVTVTSAPAVPPDFVLGLPSGSLQIASGGQGSTSFSLTANSAYNGAITLTTDDLPKNMTVSFSPSRVTLAPNATATVTLNVSANASSTAALRTGAGFVLAAPVCCLLFGFARGRRLLHRLRGPLVMVALVAAISLSGCASDSTKTHTGDYTIVVRAIPSVAGATGKAFNVVIHVD
ncbi:MAG: hypothetical protein HIU93_12280 [Acidobacteria bacterium]|nr:hypothetical protein [Acidobacteriota bacterium]